MSAPLRCSLIAAQVTEGDSYGYVKRSTGTWSYATKIISDAVSKIRQDDGSFQYKSGLELNNDDKANVVKTLSRPVSVHYENISKIVFIDIEWVSKEIFDRFCPKENGQPKPTISNADALALLAQCKS